LKFEYFIVLIVTAAVPLIKSFSKEINFYKPFKRFFTAISVPFVLFVIIDAIAVKRGLWTFNKEYVTGIYFFGLPVEEILFFAVIPFSCIFTWETVKYINKKFISR
jgi:lycopene cyclase domain-containing protein